MTAVDVAAALPEISVLRDRCRAMAVLDAILSPEWESRYFSFGTGWGPGQYFPDGADPDGADSLFALLLEGTGDAYRRFAEDYYDLPVDGDAVSSIYALQPLSEEVVQRLNPDMSLQDMADDLAEIGYPSRESG